MMAFLSACDVLATEGARDAIANGREIREFEDANLNPLRDEMNDLWVTEIEPRERELEDLRHDMQRLEEDVLRPLWDAQGDPWAPGGDAAVAQAEFDEERRLLDVLQREIELEQRELDVNWQDLWNGSTVDPEYQILEDLRYDKQRELDRLYRFGNRPIDDLWDQINELHASQGFANTDSQIESETLNIELRRLWDLMEDVQNGSSNDANALYDRAASAQNDLNDLYNFGWNPINDIYSEIERLESERGFTSTGLSTDSITSQIVELEDLRTSYAENRDAEIAAWEASLGSATTDTTVITTTELSEDALARITELKALIADLEAEAAELVAAKEAEVDDLAAQIDEKKDSYQALIDDATATFTTNSESLLASAAEIAAQIDELEEIGGDDANAQIAELQPQHDALIASEEAEEADLHVLIEGYENEREAGVDELKEQRDAIEALLLSGLTDDIDAQIAVYQAEIDELQASATSTSTAASASGTQSTDDILASIESSKNYWNGLIEELTAKIVALNEQLDSTGSGTSDVDARIHSLKLQAQELENELHTKIQNLENLVAELYRQADSFNSGDSAEVIEIQRQIDAINEKLEAIWQQNSSDGLDILIQVQALEKQVRILEEERETEQYRLEEELWDLNDQLSRFYKDQNSGTQAKEAEYQAIADDLQQRRFALDEQRWALDDKQQAIWNEVELKQIEANEEIKRIEEEQFGALRAQMRALEEELKVFYNQQRDLEIQIREAEQLVEQKKRELEDKVFDALESAAGTVDEAGDTVLTATEESGTDDSDPGADEATATVPADGTAN